MSYSFNNQSESDLLNQLELPMKVKISIQEQEGEFKKVNDYDYNQVLKQFRQVERIKKYRKKLLAPIKKQNSRWKDTLERSQDQKEEMIQRLKEKAEKKIAEKENRSASLKQNNQFERNMSKKNRIEKARSSQDKIKSNLNKFYEKFEKERLITEKIVGERLDKRAQNQIKNLSKIKKKFEEKRKSAEKRFDICITELENETKQKQEKTNENKLKQFQNWYFTMQSNKKKIIQKMDKQKTHKENAEYLQKTLEHKYEQQRLMTQQHLDNSERLRVANAEKKKKKIKEEIEKHKSLEKQTIQTKMNLIATNREIKKDLLKYQISKLAKSQEKDVSIDLNKSNLQ